MSDQKVTITFQGDNLVDALLEAYAESAALLSTMPDAPELPITRPEPAPEPNLKVETGNGVDPDEITFPKEGPQSNEAVMVSALDLLKMVYVADRPLGALDPTAAINALLDKYAVKSLNEVPVERASELFADANELADTYGVRN